MQKTVQEALDLAAKDGSIELGLEFDGKVATRGERISKDRKIPLSTRNAHD